MAENKNAYVIDSRKPIPYPKIKGWDEVIVETAGFVPLAVRFKQMEQAGYRARFNESEFSSRDISDMYLNHPEFDIQPDDDIEEMLEKTELRQSYIKSLQEKIMKQKAETDNTVLESETKKKVVESSATGEESKA